MSVLRYCCFRWLVYDRALVFEPSRPLACIIMLVWLIYVVELCCDIFPWVLDLDRTHLRAWLVYGQIGGVTLAYKISISHVKIFCCKSISPHSRALSASWRISYARCATHHHQQLHHHHLWRKRHKYMGMGTPLGNCQAWGRCPGIVSPSHFYLYHFFSLILLVISWSSRIKFSMI